MINFPLFPVCALEIDIDALVAQLQREGAEAFDKSWNDLLKGIASKREALKKAG
jgi:transaldolase